MEALKERGVQLLSLGVLVLVWQLAALRIDSDALPAPTLVGERFWGMLTDGTAFGPLSSTLTSTAIGFVVGFLAGLTYGIVAYVWPRFGEITIGLFNIALFAPTLIVIFLGLVMLGHSNRLSVVLIAALAIFPNIGVYIRDALRALDGDLQNMATSFKVSFGQRIRDVYIPFLVPPMLGAGRIGFSMAWKVAFLCEVFGFPDGLGWMVRQSYTIYDMVGLLSWLAVFIVALLIIEQFTRVFERAVVKW